MAKRVKIKHGEKEIEGEQLEFETDKEDWNRYRTEDGSIIKLKVIVSKIVRLDEYNQATGDPLYVVNSTNFVDADVPEQLKKRNRGNDKKVQ